MEKKLGTKGGTKKSKADRKLADLTPKGVKRGNAEVIKGGESADKNHRRALY